jgi:pimeloyl-ACP methyl ester carboxylesterase
MRQRVRDGVVLAYAETGRGDPPILLIHGGMNDHAYFAPQLDHLGRCHRTVAVDLRGHGRSGKPRQDYTIRSFADDVAWLCKEIGLAKPVIVGHSMGGLVALEAAAGFADLPTALVILDAPVVPPRPFADTLRPFAAALRAPSYREAIRAFLSPFVGFADDPGRAQRLLADMAATPQHVIASTMDDYLAYDSAAAAAACKVPLLYVSSGPWFADVARLRELCPQLVTGQTVGSGHYHQLEVPEQVNAMIDRFVAVTLVRRA